MSYYGVGDYYMAGDPGFLSSIGGFFKKAIGVAAGQLPVVGPAITVGRTIIGGRGPAPVRIVRPAGGAPGPMIGLDGRPGRKRRRMNYANDRALKRSIRRQAGFVKLAKKALKGSGYMIVSKGSRRSSRPLSIKESGPGSVHVS